MEEQIKEKLEEIYTNLIIDVKYLSIRQYKIIYAETYFIYTYDAHLTFDYNIDKICNIIDKSIVRYYKKGEF